MKIFITGGAGFIASHFIKEIYNNVLDPKVLVYDNLHPQVHGKGAKPQFRYPVDFVLGDVRDSDLLLKTVGEFDPDIIVHLASETGTGQSLDEIVRYTEVNVTGTAALLSAIGKLPRRARKFLLSSSRSIYGEGPYIRPDGSRASAPDRSLERMAQGDFGVVDFDGVSVSPVAANNKAFAQPRSVYASTKLAQEHLLQNCSGAMSLIPIILRFQNVYGPGQSLHNPYTGVLSIFSQQALSGKTLNIYEDGKIIRDFVFVEDVARAMMSAVQKLDSSVEPIDIGSGIPVQILDVARLLLEFLGRDANSTYISGNFRPGDIRAAWADISRAEALLGWRPQVKLEEGLRQFAEWARDEIEAAARAADCAVS